MVTAAMPLRRDVRYNQCVNSPQLSPTQAWARLEAGNRHWAAGQLEHPDQDVDRRHQVAARQDPFATIVSCIDSRLPPETIFDQGIGDLFAVRTGAQVVRAQIHRTVHALAHDGPLADLVASGDLGIVGAYYDLDTGAVARLHAFGL
jgi:carbonic anhydrase